jgi:hypothetical protein
VPRLRCQRAVQRNDVARREQLVHGHKLAAKFLQALVFVHVVDNDVAAEVPEQARDEAADAAAADNASGLSCACGATQS